MATLDSLVNGSVNVGRTERRLSMAGGGALVLYALARRTLASALLGLLGGGLVYRGVTGHCPAYARLGIDTARDAESDAESARVDEASEDSFPASDAPAWTPTTSVGHPQQ